MTVSKDGLLILSSCVAATSRVVEGKLKFTMGGACTDVRRRGGVGVVPTFTGRLDLGSRRPMWRAALLEVERMKPGVFVEGSDVKFSTVLLLGGGGLMGAMSECCLI